MVLDSRFRIRLDGSQCVYCGMRSNSMDHFPPASLTARGFLFPACRECNSLAGTDYGLDLKKRIALVKDKLLAKYKGVLSMPIWSSDEIDELDGNMKREVIRCQKNKRIVSSRIAWNAESYLASIGLTKDFAQILAECSTTTE